MDFFSFSDKFVKKLREKKKGSTSQKIDYHQKVFEVRDWLWVLSVGSTLIQCDTDFKNSTPPHQVDLTALKSGR